MPILKKPAPSPQSAKTATKSAPPKQSGEDAFSKRYNESTGKAGFVPPDPGQYNAIITEIQCTRDDESVKESVYFEVCIADQDSKDYGKKFRMYYNITNDKGENMPGLDFLKSSLALLGFNDPIKSWNHLQEICAEIAQQQPWVIIDVKKNGKYTNIYLNSVPENQDEKPELPPY